MAVCWLLTIACGVVQAATLELSVVPSAATVAPGERFTVAIEATLSGSERLYGGGYDVAFDPAVVRLLGRGTSQTADIDYAASPGTLPGVRFVFVRPVTLGTRPMADADPARPGIQFRLGTLDFEALAAGTTEIGLVLPDRQLTYDAAPALPRSFARGELTVVPATVTVTPPLDSDGDGVPDAIDNAIFVPNPRQIDSDGDGFGNIVDADFNNDGIVGFSDILLFKTDLNKRTSPGAPYRATDLNADGVVGFSDVLILKGLLNKPPGPSAAVVR